jgi:hypothetical protein
MKINSFKTIRVAILAICCGAAVAAAQDTMTLTGVGDGYVMGGVYVSPYQGNVTNKSGNVIYSGYVICDDFATESFLNNPWSVNVTQSAASLTGQEKFSNPKSFAAWNAADSAQQDYNAVSWLASNLMQPANMNNETLADEYSYAIWSIFDNAAINSVTGVNGLSQGQVTTAVTNLITEAFQMTANGYSGPTVTVYSPSPASASQEFLVVQTPEPARFDLAVDMAALLGLVVLARRRLLAHNRG